MTLLRIPTRVSAAADRPASYGNQTTSSTRANCWIQISTVDVINIAADHQMFMTLTGELSWQRLRRSAIDFYKKKEKSLLEPPFSGLSGYGSLESHCRLYIRRNWTFSLSPTNHCWCQKTRVIAVSCGIKISEIHHLVLSQYMRLTDGRTDGWTDRQNCDSNTVRCITCSRTVKNGQPSGQPDNASAIYCWCRH